MQLIQENSLINVILPDEIRFYLIFFNPIESTIIVTILSKMLNAIAFSRGRLYIQKRRIYPPSTIPNPAMVIGMNELADTKGNKKKYT